MSSSASSSSDSSISSEPSGEDNVPLSLRVGGAFMALAIVLFIFTLLDLVVYKQTTIFIVTPRFLMICAAALIIGAYASLGAGQRHSINRVVALVVALLLVVLSRFVPFHVVAVLNPWLLLPAYGGLALICSLVLRRSML